MVNKDLLSEISEKRDSFFTEGHQISADGRYAVFQLYDNGYSPDEIAKVTTISRATVYRVLKNRVKLNMTDQYEACAKVMHTQDLCRLMVLIGETNKSIPDMLHDLLSTYDAYCSFRNDRKDGVPHE